MHDVSRHMPVKTYNMNLPLHKYCILHMHFSDHGSRGLLCTLAGLYVDELHAIPLRPDSLGFRRHLRFRPQSPTKCGAVAELSRWCGLMPDSSLKNSQQLSLQRHAPERGMPSMPELVWHHGCPAYQAANVASATCKYSYLTSKPVLVQVIRPASWRDLTL